MNGMALGLGLWIRISLLLCLRLWVQTSPRLELGDLVEKVGWRHAPLEIISHSVFFLVSALHVPFKNITLGVSPGLNLSLLPMGLFLVSHASWLQLLIPREGGRRPLKTHQLLTKVTGTFLYKTCSPARLCSN